MTNNDDKKTGLGFGSTQPKEDDEGILKQQVLSNRQQLLNNLSANQPGSKPQISPVSSQHAQPASPAPPTPPPPSPPAPQNQVVSQASIPAQNASESLPMPKIVEVVFDTLKKNCLEANKSLANTDAELHCQNPQSFQERLDKASNQQIRFLRGHISLPNYSLVIDSSDSRIAIFIVPSEFVLGFDPDSELFSPHLLINSSVQSGQSGWFIGNTQIGIVMLPEISRQLLRNLIGVARGEIDPKQPFTHGQEAVSPPAQVQPSIQMTSQAGLPASEAPVAPNVESPPPAALSNVTAAPKVSEPTAITRSQTIKNLMNAAAGTEQSSPVALIVEGSVPKGAGQEVSNGLVGLLQGAESKPEPPAMARPPASPVQNNTRNPLKDSMEFAKLSELISQENEKAEELGSKVPENKPNSLPMPPGLQQPPSIEPRPQPVLPQPPGMQKPPEEKTDVATTMQELAITANPNASLTDDPSNDSQALSAPESNPVHAHESGQLPTPPSQASPPPAPAAIVPPPPPQPSAQVQPKPAPPEMPKAPGAEQLNTPNPTQIPEIPLTQASPAPDNPPEVPAADAELPLKSGAFPQVQEPQSSGQELLEENKPPVQGSVDLNLQSQTVAPAPEAESKPEESSDTRAKVKPTLADLAVPSATLSGEITQVATGSEPPEKEEDPKPIITGIERPKKSLSSLLLAENEPASEKPEPKAAADTAQTGDLGQLVTDTEKHLSDGCGELMDYIEKALGSLKALGVDAMQNDNLDQVTEIMQHTKRLKELKDKLDSLKNEVE